MHAHKFKSVQEDAKKRVDKLETAMDANLKLRLMDRKIRENESTLATMRADAWLQRKKAMEKV